jgi:hypothetical protein
MGKRGQTASPRKPARPYRVFISHATADKWIALILCEKLNARGVSTFRDDRDIKGGDDIPETIQRELARSDELLVLFTPHSINRTWVILEVGMAIARKRRIIPVLCHVSIDPIPAMIRSKKAYELNDVERYFDEVVERMSARTK